MALVDFGFFSNGTRRAKTQGRFLEKSGFLDFFHFAFFPVGLGILDFA